MTKMSNDEKIKNVRVRKILKILIIIFAVLTIVFSGFSLIQNLNPVFALICFLIEVGLNKYRDHLDPKEESKEKGKK